jgi:uncharacterized protein YdhG (YjbR/CyaY superfamily)
MKKAASGNRGSAMKGNFAPKTVDEYLAGVPEPARTTLERVRAVIRSAAPPEATEVISYRIPMFKYQGMLMGFAAFANHCSLFPGSLSAMKELKNELKNFETSKGTIRLPVDKSPSATLIKKLVKTRLAENERKSRR